MVAITKDTTTSGHVGGSAASPVNLDVTINVNAGCTAIIAAASVGLQGSAAIANHLDAVPIFDPAGANLSFTPMTPENNSFDGTTATDFMQMWILKNPPSGTGKTVRLRATYDSGPTLPRNNLLCMTVQGALDPGMFEYISSTSFANGGSTPVTKSHSSMRADDMLLGFAGDGNTVPTVSTGTSDVSLTGTNNTASDNTLLFHNTGSGSVTVGANVDTTDYNQIMAVRLVAQTVVPKFLHASNTGNGGGGGANVTTYISGSFTPDNNSLVRVLVAAQAQVGPWNVSSFSVDLVDNAGTSLGLTATRQVYRTPGGTASEGEFLMYWTIPVTTGVLSKVKVTSTNACWIIMVDVAQFTNHDSSSPIGVTGNINQSSGDGTVTASLSSGPNANSIVDGGRCLNTDAGPYTATPLDNSYKELNDTGLADTVCLQSQYRMPGSTNTSWGYADVQDGAGSASSNAMVIAVEIKLAPTGLADPVSLAHGDLEGSGTMSKALTGVNATAGKRLMLGISNQTLNNSAAVTQETFTITDDIGDTGGTTWTRYVQGQRVAVANAAWCGNMEWWTRMVGTTPGANKTVTITGTMNGGAQTTSTGNGIFADLIQVDGNLTPRGKVASPIPAAANGTSLALTLDQTPLAGSIVLTLGQDWNNYNALTAPTGFTTLNTAHFSGDTLRGAGHSAFKNGSVSNPHTWTIGSSTNLIGAAVELASSSAVNYTESADTTVSVTTEAVETPTKPLSLTATPGNTSAILAWAAPTGGAPITDYKVQYRPTPIVAPAGFRYWRWRATARSGGLTGSDYTHANEFYLSSGGTRIPATSVKGLDPNSGFGLATALNDNDTTTRHLTLLQSFWIVFDYGTAVNPDAYRWYTGPDSPDRDPISWVLDASNDGIWFTTIDTKTSYSVTTSRQALVGPFSITVPSDPGPPIRSGGQTYQYFRWTPTAVRGGAGSAVQYGEFWMLSEGERIAPTSLSSPFSPASYGNDFDVGSKVIDGTVANGQLTLNFGSAQNFDGYMYWTAGDATDRDPVSWTLEGSLNGTSWTLIDTKTGITPTTDRYSKVGPYTI